MLISNESFDLIKKKRVLSAGGLHGGSAGSDTNGGALYKKSVRDPLV
jgi:hypothetical protein